MPSISMRSHRFQRGFNLVELMIALALGLLVILGASSVFLSNRQSYRTHTALSEVQENSRIAFELLSRDLRQARLTGCGNQGTVSNLLNNNTNTGNWFADYANRGLIGFDGDEADDNPALTTGTSSGNHVAGTDNITLIGADDVSYSLEANYVAATGLDITESSPELGAGDLIIVCDPSQADIVQITSVASGKFRIASGTGTPGNSAGLAYIYQRSSTLVSKLKSVTWYIGCNPVTALACNPARGGTSLYRMTAVGVASTVSVQTQAQEMVRGVASLDLNFHRNGEAAFEEANAITSWDPSIIDAVRATMQFVALDRSSGTETPILRSLSSTVALRNPPKN
jgi:type IV pilus assembly protein PilW